jgi:cytochrome c-type biogenesis protein CcmH
MRLLLAALALLLVAVAPASAAPTFQELEEALTCQCGCGLTVHACNHLQCPSAIPLRREIRAQMALGKTKEQILAYFSDKYGEKILSSPTASGFNLTAWVMPFLMLAVGTVFVVFTLLRWRRRGQAPPPAGPQPVEGPATSTYERQLDRELAEFDR